MATHKNPASDLIDAPEPLRAKPELQEGNFDIHFNPNPVQRQFIESRADADFFCSRFREGKSCGLVWACFYHCINNPSPTWAIIRDTYMNLQRTTLQEFFQWFPPGVAGLWKASEKMFQFGVGENRSKVYFMGLDAAEDISKLQSLPLGGFGIDEAAPAIDKGGVSTAGVDQLIFNAAMGRLSETGMVWHAAKLAANNPDETHWTYNDFVEPGTEGFSFWQPTQRENEDNIATGYYARLQKALRHRPALWRRFGEGKFGFSQIGKSITPEWRDEVHLIKELEPIRNYPLHLSWDFGAGQTALPACVISQLTPSGGWHILDAFVGDDMGTTELIEDVVKPRLMERFGVNGRVRHELKHTGDPAGSARDQSSSKTSSVKVIRKALGGTWIPGPRGESERIEPLRAVLRRHNCVLVDKTNARLVWLALRGGWHRNITRTGVIGAVIKDDHSHIGDAMGYQAARLFPMGRIGQRGQSVAIRQPRFYGEGRRMHIPRHGEQL